MLEINENEVEEAVFSLDELVTTEGEELDKDKVKFMNVNKGQLIYDDNSMPMPGEKANLPTAEDVTMDKEQLEDKMAKTNAMLKLKEEQAAYNKLSDDEKIKDYVLQSQFYYQTNNWFNKYGYQMSGKQKRNLKRDLEMAWKKGKFKLTEDQKRDILFELSKASNVNKDEKKKAPSAADHIANLNSAIFKM